jgi:anti-anti-sigma factor
MRRSSVPSDAVLPHGVLHVPRPNPLIAGSNSVSLTYRGGILTLDVRKAGQVTILDIRGPLKLGPTEEAFRAQVQKLTDSGANHLAVNLAGIAELDSSGIGALVRLFTNATRAGGKCVFYAPTKQVSMLLKMVRLNTVFDIVEDEAAALSRV